MARLDGEQFMRLVQTRADLSEANARAAIDAVLSTLSERISGGEFRDIVSELADDVTRSLPFDATRPAESFDSGEFLRRVGDRLGVETDRAEDVTHAVLSVLAEALSKQEAGDVRSELPADLKPLFQEVSRPTQTP